MNKIRLMAMGIIILSSTAMGVEINASSPEWEEEADEIAATETGALQVVEDEAEWSRMVTMMFTRYVEWHNVEFNGKIKIAELPLDPTVKMYFEKENLIQISVRVPLLGEIGRVQITPQELLLVNKYNNVYSRESMGNLLEMYPGLISDVQSLMLGRVVIPGSGELRESTLNEVSFMGTTADEDWIVIPNIMPGDGSMEYGYVVMPNGRTSALYGSMAGRKVSLLLKYVYSNNSMGMNVSADTGKKKFEGSLDFSSIRWGGSRMQEVNLTNYRQVNVKDFFKSFKF